MSKGGKGGGGTQTTNTTATPWSGVQPFLTQGYNSLAGEFGQGAPTYYPGSTIASMNPLTQGALGAQAQRGMTGSPLTTAAQGQLTDTMAGKYLDAGNPYFSGAVDAAIRPVQDNYQKNILPGVDSAFSSAGRYGSGAHQGAIDTANTGFNTAVGDISSKMAYDNYAKERQNQMTGMLTAPGLAQQDYFDINQVGASGSALDAYNQANINADVERYNYGQNADWLRTQDFISSLQAMPMGSSSQSKMPGNAFSSALGTGVGALGLANMFGLFGGGGGGLGALAGGLAFSDERLKTDIKRVGTLDNDLPVYKYRYIWDKPDTPKRLGVMAQEALETRPEAVGSFGQLLVVDYDKVTS